MSRSVCLGCFLCLGLKFLGFGFAYSRRFFVFRVNVLGLGFTDDVFLFRVEVLRVRLT